MASENCARKPEFRMGYSMDDLLRRIEEWAEMGRGLLASLSAGKDAEAAVKDFFHGIKELSEEAYGGPTDLSREFESKKSHGPKDVEEGGAALKVLHESILFSEAFGF